MRKYCQSCGMPLASDPEHGGNEKDGSKSELYCSYCYKEGVFTKSEIKTEKQMQEFCFKLMRDKGYNRILAWLFTRGIPRLERWKQRNF